MISKVPTRIVPPLYNSPHPRTPGYSEPEENDLVCVSLCAEMAVCFGNACCWL
jgi:hypothetical protein